MKDSVGRNSHLIWHLHDSHRTEFANISYSLLHSIDNRYSGQWCWLSFKSHSNLGQGDGLCCLILNIALEGVMGSVWLDNDFRGTILFRSLQFLGFVDDIDIIGRIAAQLCEAYTRLKREAARIRLRINVTKTKYLLAGNPDQPGSSVLVDGDNLEVVKEFCYLGTVITSDNGIKVFTDCWNPEDFLTTLIWLRYIAHRFTRWSSMDMNHEPSEPRIQTLRACLNVTSSGPSLAVCSSMEFCRWRMAGRMRWLKHVRRMSDACPIKKVLDSDPQFGTRRRCIIHVLPANDTER